LALGCSCIDDKFCTGVDIACVRLKLKPKCIGADGATKMRKLFGRKLPAVAIRIKPIESVAAKLRHAVGSGDGRSRKEDRSEGDF